MFRNRVKKSFGKILNVYLLSKEADQKAPTMHDNWEIISYTYSNF